MILPALRGWRAFTSRLTGWGRRRADNRPRNYLPCLEPLEARWLLSTFTVLNNLDSGAGSLRAAIAAANPAGGDTIGFAPDLAGQTITLTSGELLLDKSLTITGPGAGQLTVSGNNASRVFLINGGASATLSGLTITGGNSMGSPEDPVFGGGILSFGTLALNDDVLTGNTASTGGGIVAAFGSLTVNRTTVSNNSASQAAGLYLQDEQVVIDSSTISSNQAQDTGGLRFESDFSTSDSLTITNTTISNNAASSSTDAALRLSTNTGQTVAATLSNDTISGNALTGAGGTGGIRIFAGGTVNATLTNTIVAGNTSGGSPADLLGTFNATSAHNLIGSGGNLTNGQNGNLVGVNNPLLAPLGNYGGPTQTMALLPGSPAIDAGDNTNAPGTDQRGLARIVGGTIDIGAFESRGFTLAVAGGDNQGTNVNAAFPAPLQVTVTSAFGEPVQGGIVTFTAPASGASATFPGGNTATIDAAGSAGVSATASGTPGSYAVSAAAAGASPASFGLTNFPVLTISGPATVEAQQPYTLTLSSTPLGGVIITAWTIRWGDGTIDTLPGDPTTATHVYANSATAPNSYQISATATTVGLKAVPANPPLLVTVLTPAVAVAKAAVVNPGDSATLDIPGTTGLTATLTNAGRENQSLTLFVALYQINPTRVPLNAAAFFDARVSSTLNGQPTRFVPEGTTLIVTFRFPPTTPSPTLLFFDSSTGTYKPVQSSPAPPGVQLPSPAPGELTVVFDSNSFPAISDLGGTVFPIAIQNTPASDTGAGPSDVGASSAGAAVSTPVTITTNLSPAVALALARQGNQVNDAGSGLSSPVTFKSSNNLSLNLTAPRIASPPRAPLRWGMRRRSPPSKQRSSSPRSGTSKTSSSRRAGWFSAG